MATDQPRIVIVDHGMGNLFSIKHAFKRINVSAIISSDKEVIKDADGIILPGVGAFADAMKALITLHIDGILYQVAREGTPFLGICLGMQLLMESSQEFGVHKGLGIIPGEVVPFSLEKNKYSAIKIPHMGWNKILLPKKKLQNWEGSILNGFKGEEFMYFVHSYYVRPKEIQTVLSESSYGRYLFPSTIQQNNIIGCQYHPERSGPVGLKLYQNFLSIVKNYKEKGKSHA